MNLEKVRHLVRHATWGEFYREKEKYPKKKDLFNRIEKERLLYEKLKAELKEEKKHEPENDS